MKNKLFQFFSFLNYINKAGHCRGHNVHSPFVFDLITNVIEEKNPYYIYNKIEEIRLELLSDKSEIYVLDCGTGTSGVRKISEIASKSLKKPLDAQLLFRLVNQIDPSNIVELGTSLGLTTAYLASVDTRVPVYSFDASSELIAYAKKNSDRLNLFNVKYIEGDINSTLHNFLKELDELGFVFFDANHTEEATIQYFLECENKISNKTVFVFDDIHSSKGMEQAWCKIFSHPKVTVTIDLFKFGIVYFNPELKKQHYVYLYK